MSTPYAEQPPASLATPRIGTIEPAPASETAETRTDERSYLDRLARFGVLAALAAVCLQVGLFVFDFLVLGHAERQKYAILDPGYEESPFQWLSASATFLSGVAVLMLLLRGSAVRKRDVYLVAGLLFVSMDDALAIHENVGQFLHDHIDTYIVVTAVWAALYLPALLGVFLLLAASRKHLEQRAAILVTRGLGLLALAIATHYAFKLFARTTSRPVAGEVLLQSIEEAAELAGWMLIATGFLVALAASLSRQGAGPPEAI